MTDLLATVVSATFFFAVVRTTVPILLAALGGLFADLSGALNVALEGAMLAGALAAVIASSFFPWWTGLLAGVAVGAAIGALMSLFHLRFGADVVLVGFAVNLMAAGGTVFVLAQATGGDRGSSLALPSQSIPRLELPWLEAIPAVGPALAAALSGHSYLTWFALALVPLSWGFLYRTSTGLRLRAVGEYAPAAAAAGISADRLRTLGLVLSGALAALGGVQLAMFNYIGFTRDMTAGRGFIALGAVLLGARRPLGTAVAALLFGAFEALAVTLPALYAGIPGELIHTIPFAVTVIALVVYARRAQLLVRRQAAGVPS
ncbi:MAG: ABC transporter permease [Chloroflexia bacterium]|nr:ABC transporter permease [Chloroflexia bacterium]